MSFTLHLFYSCYLLISTAAYDGYYISPNKLKWFDANHYCKAFCNSTLASIHSAANQLSVIQLASNTIYIDTPYGSKNIWIGLSIDTTHNTFQWSDLTVFDFHNLANTTANMSHTCIAMDTSYQWIPSDCNDHHRFMCNSCDSKLNKYLMINTKLNYTNALKFCTQNAHNASLASIHSASDYQDTFYLSGYDESWHTFIGLNDIRSLRHFEWTDGTTFDYGRIPGVIPWRPEEPNNSNELERCVALYQSERWWNDISCINDVVDHKHTFLCNMPSELCFHEQWLIIPNTWSIDGCDAQSTVNGVMILTGKEFINTNNILVIEYMFTMHEWSADGQSGIRLYASQHENVCDFMAILVTGNWSISLVKYENGKTNVLHKEMKKMNHVFGEYYRLKITIKNGTYYTVQVNDIFVMNEFHDITSNRDVMASNTLNRSGFIALYNDRMNITVKSLFVSGSPMTPDMNHRFDFNQCATAHPTIDPTFTPTPDPTVSPTADTVYGISIVIKFKYVIDVNTSTKSYILSTELLNITRRIILDEVRVNHTCVPDIRIEKYTNHENDGTFSINLFVIMCDEISRDAILNQNETLKINFMNTVNNESQFLLSVRNTELRLDTMDILPHVKTTQSIASFASTIYPSITSSEKAVHESEVDTLWAVTYILIGMVSMGCICCIILLVFYGCNKQWFSAKEEAKVVKKSIANAIQIAKDVQMDDSVCRQQTNYHAVYMENVLLSPSLQAMHVQHNSSSVIAGFMPSLYGMNNIMVAADRASRSLDDEDEYDYEDEYEDDDDESLWDNPKDDEGITSTTATQA
eukprot:1064540_1